MRTNLSHAREYLIRERRALSGRSTTASRHARFGGTFVEKDQGAISAVLHNKPFAGHDSDKRDANVANAKLQVKRSKLRLHQRVLVHAC